MYNYSYHVMVSSPNNSRRYGAFGKIEAIAMLREVTKAWGYDIRLKDAKDLIEQSIRELDNGIIVKVNVTLYCNVVDCDNLARYRVFDRKSGAVNHYCEVHSFVITEL